MTKRSLGSLNTTEQDLLRRAFAAWFRTGGTDQPANTSRVTQHDGLWYAVLENVRGTMAVYRLKNDGVLRKLRRWPEEVAEPNS